MSDSGVTGLTRIEGRGWRSGLPNLMGAGFGSWWRTSNWWVQSLLWTVVINGSLAVVIWSDAPEELDVFTLYGVMTMFAAIAVAILMQEEVVGEKRSGTAAWVLSMPVSRPAFLTAKLVPNAVGVVATMIVIPSAALLIQLALADAGVSIPRFVGGASVAALNLLFYLTLTLMLGTLFDSAGPVIAIPLAFAFGQQLVGSLPALLGLLPWSLVVPINGEDTSVVGAIISGTPGPSYGAIVTTAIVCVVFTIIAYWKWNRTEL